MIAWQETSTEAKTADDATAVALHRERIQRTIAEGHRADSSLEVLECSQNTRPTTFISPLVHRPDHKGGRWKEIGGDSALCKCV